MSLVTVTDKAALERARFWRVERLRRQAALARVRAGMCSSWSQARLWRVVQAQRVLRRTA